MLLLGYLPFSFEDHGIGQCIAPQNVTLRGGICDLGSIKKNKQISSDKEYYQILQASGVILSNTFRELLLDPLPDLIYEFDNPSTSTYLLSAFVHKRLELALRIEARKGKCAINPRLKKFFNLENNNAFENILKKIFL